MSHEKWRIFTGRNKWRKIVYYPENWRKKIITKKNMKSYKNQVWYSGTNAVTLYIHVVNALTLNVGL